MLKQKVEQLELKAKLFRGFGDVTRLSILEAILDEEKTVTEISEELDHSQSNISNHLSCLFECGLVKTRREKTGFVFQYIKKFLPGIYLCNMLVNEFFCFIEYAVLNVI